VRYIRPFLVGEEVKPIPVNSIISCTREFDGYTYIKTTLRPKPFVTTLTNDEVMNMKYGENDGR